MGEIIHGKSSSYSNHWCRCAECKAAWAELQSRMKLQRRSRPVPDHLHGTANGYGNYGCRCRPCTDVWSADSVARRKRRIELGDQTKNIGSGNVGRGKISAVAGESIRHRAAGGERAADLAREYEVSLTAIYLVIEGRIAPPLR